MKKRKKSKFTMERKKKMRKKKWTTRDFIFIVKNSD